MNDAEFAAWLRARRTSPTVPAQRGEQFPADVVPSDAYEAHSHHGEYGAARH